MSKRVPVFRQTTGLNNVVDPIRHKYDPAVGCLELAAAVNVDVDDTGSLRRRSGRSLLWSGIADNIWSHGDLCYFTSVDALFQFNQDLTVTVLRSGLTLDAPMSYAHVNDRTFYANGEQNGVIYDNASWSWVGEPYVGPETKYNVKIIPPVGHLLEIMGGRMLIAVGSSLYQSLPYGHSWFREGCDVVRFRNKLTMVAVLPGGVWISDQDQVYWLQGMDITQWAVVPHGDVGPAIPGTMKKCDGSRLSSLKTSGPCCIWTGSKGIFVGTGQGQLLDLTQGRLTYPETSRGSALIIDDQRYVCTMFP